MRFLIVDDSPTMRRILINTLASLGHTDIIEAEDGADGLIKVQTMDIDFVITEWNLSKITGLELIMAIRSDESISKLPVLMVTSRGTKEDLIEALKAKANGYVLKPFTPSVLKEKITSILKSFVRPPE